MYPTTSHRAVVHRPRPWLRFVAIYELRPQFTYGHSLNKTLTRAGFPSEFKEWTELAQNRELWRARVYGLAEYPTPPPVRASS